MTTRRQRPGRGSVYADKARPGSYIAQLKADGRNYRRRAPTEDAAWEVIDQLRGELRRSGAISSTQSVGSYLDDWLETARVRPSTLAGYRSKVRLYLKPSIGGVRLDRLTPQHLRRMYRELESRQLAPRTIRQTHAILRAALRQALEDGLVSRNVAAIAAPPEIPNVEGRSLTPEQSLALLRQVEGHRLEAAYALGVLCGLRQGEILGLRWGDVDRDVVRIRQTLGRVGRQYVTGEPKTLRSRRTVPLPAHAAALLEARRILQAREVLPAGTRARDRLVFTGLGGGPLNGSWLTHDLARQLRAAGLPHVSFRDLRHSAATLMQAQGFTPREVMDVLGHATFVTTMNVYTHIPEAALRAKVDRLDAWLGEPRGEPQGGRMRTGLDSS